MIFALGFLSASLLALLVIPAVNARAERLARRRVEAQFPLSITELTAEKDQLRAEFAVLQRRLERKAEEALAEKHASMEELGRRAVRIQSLETELAARDGRIGELEAELAATRRKLSEVEEALATASAALVGARETSGALEQAHRQTLTELSATRAKLDTTETALAEARTRIVSLEEALAARETAFADLDARYGATLQDLDMRRIAVSDLETRLATQTARADELERVAEERRSEVQTLQMSVDELRRELASLKDELAAARRAEQADAAIKAENAELRRRIDEVADSILRHAEGQRTHATSASQG